VNIGGELNVGTELNTNTNYNDGQVPNVDVEINPFNVGMDIKANENLVDGQAMIDVDNFVASGDTYVETGHETKQFA